MAAQVRLHLVIGQGGEQCHAARAQPEQPGRAHQFAVSGHWNRALLKVEGVAEIAKSGNEEYVVRRLARQGFHERCEALDKWWARHCRQAQSHGSAPEAVGSGGRRIALHVARAGQKAKHAMRGRAIKSGLRLQAGKGHAAFMVRCDQIQQSKGALKALDARGACRTRENDGSARRGHEWLR